jgi:hypothetical protein
VHAARSRLETAIAATGINLPVCSVYARTTDVDLLPEAEREPGEALNALRAYRR